MKILHALVTYLAFTTLPAPFHSFSFASPLAAAIDYDGYVNTSTQYPIDGALTSTGIKRILGSIIETCQTVNYHSGYYMNTTQNHTNNALIKRVPGDIIEARQEEIITGALAIALVLVVEIDIVWIGKDDSV